MSEKGRACCPTREQSHRRNHLGKAVAKIVPTAQMYRRRLIIVDRRRYRGPAYKDPLQSALDRGSDALEFLFSPLVLDYVHVKFAGTLPPWSSRNPFQPTINEGFYMYDNFEVYDLAKLFRGSGNDQAKGGNELSGTPTASTESTDGETLGSFLWQLPGSFMSFLLRSVASP